MRHGRVRRPRRLHGAGRAARPRGRPRLLSPYHARLRAELERHGGTVEKFIGDAVMAVFGAPTAHEDDPERAVRAALAIRDWAGEQPALQVRIAVNTGEALVTRRRAPRRGRGDGRRRRRQHGGAAAGGGAGQRRPRRRDDLPRDARRDRVPRGARRSTAKGKAEPLRVWEAVEAVGAVGVDLVERRRAARRPRPRARAAPLAARARARGALGAARDARRRPRHRQVAARPRAVPARRRRERADQLAPGPLPSLRRGRDVLGARRDRQGRGGDPRDRRARGGRTQAPAGGRAARPGATEARWLEARAARARRARERGGQARAEAATAAWRRFLEAIAERGPAVLVFEDLHWADDGLLDFLDDLVDWLRDVPLLVVARPGRSCSSGAGVGRRQGERDDDLAAAAGRGGHGAAAREPARPAAPARRRAAGAARARGRQPAVRRAVRAHARRARNDRRAAGVGAGRDRRAARRAAAAPRRSCSRRRRCTARSSGSAASPPRAASRRQTPRLCCARSSARTSSGASGNRRSPATRSTRSSTSCCATSRTGRSPARARGEAPPGGRVDRGARPPRRPRRAARAPLQAGARARASRRRRGRSRARRARPRGAARRRRAGAGAVRLRGRPPGSSPTRSSCYRRTIRSGRGSCCGARARSSPTAATGSALWTEALEAFRRAGDAEGVAEAATLAARFAWFAGDRAATDRYMAVALDAVADRPASRAKAEALAAPERLPHARRALRGVDPRRRRRPCRSSRRSGWRTSARACTSSSAARAAASATPAGSTRSRGIAIAQAPRALDMVDHRLRQSLVRAPLLGAARRGAARLAARARAGRALRLRPPAARRPLRRGGRGPTSTAAGTRRSPWRTS